MKRLTNTLIVVSGLLVLWTIGALMNSRPAIAQGPPDGLAVRITQPVPLPVTGTIGVTGPLTATVSGTVGLTAGTSVSINNTVGNPVRVRNVNDAIQPVQATGSCISSAGTLGCSAGSFYTVPSGKRLVIEFASLHACSLPGQSASLGVQTTVGGVSALHTLSSAPPTTSPGSNAIGCNGVTPSSVSSVSQQVRLYADGGTSVSPFVDRDNNLGAGSYEYTMSGYLVDLPLAP